MDRPNIIYLHSHDTGRCIQPYGYAVETPNLQRFAEQGVVFRNAFCAGPTCSPSRAALLTGQYPHQCGMTALAHHGGRLVDPSKPLANFLKSQGYATALSGVQHVTSKPNPEGIRELGYERALSLESWPAWAKDFEAWNQWYAQAAVDYLLKADPAKPFFLDCGFDLTHRTGTGEQWHTSRHAPDGDARYVRPPAPLPDTPETRRDFADFRVAARLLDECHGRVLAALEQAGLAENTLVLITTDHGIAYPLMKCNLTAHGTGVLLMMRAPRYGGRYVARRTPGDVAPGVPGDVGAEPEPSGMSGGKVIDSLVSHIDVFPTLCEATGLPAPAWLEGESLVPLIDGRATDVRDAVFAEVNWHAAPEPMRSVRTPRHNYIRRFAPYTGPVLPNCDDSVSKTFLRNAGWDSRAQVAEELYDLIFDPNEACNRAGDPNYAAALKEMRERLQTWMVKTNDPLLTGRLDPWPGAKSQFATDVSPQGEWKAAAPIILQAVRLKKTESREIPACRRMQRNHNRKESSHVPGNR
jgi:arylsulfatase A-like enzyme